MYKKKKKNDSTSLQQSWFLHTILVQDGKVSISVKNHL